MSDTSSYRTPENSRSSSYPDRIAPSVSENSLLDDLQLRRYQRAIYDNMRHGGDQLGRWLGISLDLSDLPWEWRNWRQQMENSDQHIANLRSRDDRYGGGYRSRRRSDRKPKPSREDGDGLEVTSCGDASDSDEEFVIIDRRGNVLELSKSELLAEDERSVGSSVQLTAPAPAEELEELSAPVFLEKLDTTPRPFFANKQKPIYHEVKEKPASSLESFWEQQELSTPVHRSDPMSPSEKSELQPGSETMSPQLTNTAPSSLSAILFSERAVDFARLAVPTVEVTAPASLPTTSSLDPAENSSVYKTNPAGNADYDLVEASRCVLS